MAQDTTPNGRTRLYVLRNNARFPDAGKPPVRLIRAYGRAGALAYAGNELFHVALATQDDLETLLPQGVQVERASLPRDD